MQTGSPTDSPDSRAVAAGGALGALRSAFAALVKGARRSGLPPGVVESPRIGLEARVAWLAGVSEALAEVPVVVIGCGPTALYYGDIPVLDGGVSHVLFNAGVRGLLIYRGATEDELLALARVLLASWPAGSAADMATDVDAGLEQAVWGLALAHIHVEMAARASSEADLRGVGRLRATDAAPLARPIANATLEDLLPADGLAYLARARERLSGTPVALPRAAVPRPVPPELTAAALAARNLGDIDAEAVASLVAAVLAQPAVSPDVAVRATSLALRYVLDTLGDAGSPSPLLHVLLENLDVELAPEGPARDAVRAAARALAEEPFRARVSRVAGELRESELRGELFSLFALVSDSDAALGLVEALPPWVARVLADAVLAAQADGVPSVDFVRKRLHANNPPDVLLGLCMAARSEDPRLIEPVLLHVDHAEAAIRGAALYALRRQRSPRVREIARSHLGDPAEAVRLEALRYCVAYKDGDIVPRLEQRLTDPTSAGASEAEIRALCIALARIQRDEATLLDFALGVRRGAHPTTARGAIAGLRAIGTPRARQALSRVAEEVPRLRAEVQALLSEER